MYNKKAQGMPMNVIIIAIIVLVVLVIIIAFFAGGFSSIVGKVKDLFGGQTAGQVRDTAIQTCQNLCDSAAQLPETAQPSSGFCKTTFVVDHDSSPDTKPKRMACRSDINVESAKDDTRKGIEVESSGLSVTCEGVVC